MSTAPKLAAQSEKVHILRETTGRKCDKQNVQDDYLNILAKGPRSETGVVVLGVDLGVSGKYE